MVQPTDISLEMENIAFSNKVPMGAKQQITFNAPPGTYRNYSDIPSHEAIGMHGRLIVKEAGQSQ